MQMNLFMKQKQIHRLKRANLLLPKDEGKEQLQNMGWTGAHHYI